MAIVPKLKNRRPGENLNRKKLGNFIGLLRNESRMRRELLSKWMEGERSSNNDYKYPEDGELNAFYYQELFDRDPIANRVVTMMPMECWTVAPEIKEDADAGTDTTFELALQSLCQRLRGESSYYKGNEGNPLFEYLKRADILTRIGQYGVILLGLDDGLPFDQPVSGKGVWEALSPSDPAGVPFGSQVGSDRQYSLPIPNINPPGFPIPDVTPFGSGEIPPISTDTSPDGTPPPHPAPPTQDKPPTPQPQFTPARNLLYLRVFPEALVYITQFEANVHSPRYGKPIQYRVTFNDPRIGYSGIGLATTTQTVHWTRIVHLADNRLSNEIFGYPEMKPVLNCILDARKVRGSDAEMYYRGAFMGLSFETHPELGPDADVDMKDIEEQVEEYFLGLKRYLVGVGFGAKPLAPQVSDPTPHINIQMEAICIQKGWPIRVFKGSERGELASSQDDSKWNDRVAQRENGYITPQVICPLIDRLINLGVLPKPPKGYYVEWPDLDSSTDSQRADKAVKQTMALTTYVSKGGKAIMDPLNFLTEVMGFTQEMAEAIIELIDVDAIPTEPVTATGSGDGASFNPAT